MSSAATGAFTPAAVRLAGMAGAAFGWTPDTFWTATPAELAALVAAAGGGAEEAPAGAVDLARMMEAHPDG